MFNQFIINKNNLINNIKQVKRNNQNSKVCAMVKADAYGVGLNEVVKIIEPFVDCFGVACFFEAQQVRTLTNKNILIVGALEENCVNEDFSYSISSIDDVKYLLKLNKRIKIHLKINTGMNRFGFKTEKQVKHVLNLIKNSKLNLQGIFTHFATSDKFINTQMTIFLNFVKLAKKEFPEIVVHADNSIVNEINNHNLDMVRIGFDLYNKSDNKFNSVVKIKSKIVQINLVNKKELVGYNYRFVAPKKMKVAVIPIGYADGLGLEYCGMNLNINNKECKILNICMDCFMLDISKVKIKKGDEIYLLNEINNLDVFAKYANISSYQVMTNFSKIRANKIILN